MIMLIHNRTDKILVSENKPSSGESLTELGRKVIQKMNRLGIIIDITHLPEHSQLEVIKLSEAPVTA